MNALQRIARDIRPYGANVLPLRGVRRFCLLTSGRSGSELLVHLLNSHPMILCEGEILTNWHDFPYLFARGRPRGARYRGKSAWGFKVNSHFLEDKYERPNPRGGLPRFVGRLARGGFVFVHVRRRNVLRQALSTIRADMGMYHLRPHEPDEGPFDVDIQWLLRLFSELDRHDAALAELVAPHPHRTLTYEDDLLTSDAQQRTADGIFEWLGLPPAQVGAAFRKIARASLRDDLKNYDEVAAAVRGTRYERFLTE